MHGSRSLVASPGRRFRLPAFALILATLLTEACGYIGGPLVPLANIPTKIADLAAVQRGGTIIAHCTVPIRTTENVLLKTPVELELRIGPAGQHFNEGVWANIAQPVSGPELQDGLATYRIPAKEWTGKEAAIGVRAIGPGGKASEWSNFEILPVVAPPEVPSQVNVKDTAAGELVAWAGRGDRFRVLRRSGGEEAYTLVATITGHEWTDAGIEYGKPYTYMVQALVDVTDKRIAESDLSESVSRTPVDTFPPAVPSGQRADMAPNAVTLVWDAGTEPDLAGYRVYRSADNGPWQKLADVNTVPTYSDTTVEHGKTYRYAVSAIDKVGNESERSAAVEVVFP